MESKVFVNLDADARQHFLHFLCSVFFISSFFETSFLFDTLRNKTIQNKNKKKGKKKKKKKKKEKRKKMNKINEARIRKKKKRKKDGEFFRLLFTLLSFNHRVVVSCLVITIDFVSSRETCLFYSSNMAMRSIFELSIWISPSHIGTQRNIQDAESEANRRKIDAMLWPWQSYLTQQHRQLNGS